MKKSTKLSLGAAGILIVAALAFCGAYILNKGQKEKASASETITNQAVIDLANRPTYDNRAELGVDQRKSAGVSLTLTSANYKDPAKLQEASDYIAVVFIDSVDGATNYAEIGDHKAMITSFGKMTILESLKGDLEPGSTKTFYRMGGAMDFNQYCEHADQTQCDKLRYLNPDRSVIAEFLIQDIEFEVGKTYLAYFIRDKGFSDEEGYTFIGLENGTREVQTAATYTLNSDPSDLKVLNNFTGEWENLSEIVNQ